VDLDPVLRPVRADPTTLEQLLVNLTVNARHAMPQGGRLTIRTCNTHGTTASDEHPVGPHVLLSVTDSGVGMAPDVRARAFEPFFTTKPTGEGTGLGLATAYGTVRQAGGAIRLDSELGRGTHVRVYLPPAEGPVTEIPGQPAPAGRGRGANVLVVEDDAPVRALIGRLLRNAGHTVHEAADGATARALVEAGRPVDLLVCGSVPGAGHRAVGGWVRAARPDARILSVDTTLDAGPGTTFLEKPFSEEQLLSAVTTALGPP